MHTSIIHNEYEWIAADGIKLYAQSWQGSNEPLAVVCLVHGLGEHSSRYILFRDLLIESELSLITFDLRGHGRSEGKRGHLPSYETIMKDIEVLIDYAGRIFPGKKLFLYGNSMGGNLVINFVLRCNPELQGVILTAPWLRLSHPPGILQTWFAEKIKNIWPDFTAIHGIKSYIKQKSKFWDKSRDKHMHRWISVNTYLTVTQAGEWALNNADKFNSPLFIIHGGFDKVTSIESSQEFISRIKVDKTLKVLENLCHNIHSEKESKIIFTSIIEWIEKHLC